jgi:ankyrin repeat protein
VDSIEWSVTIFDLIHVPPFHGYNADSNSDKQSFCTPLHLASANGHLVVAELLIQHGADINKPNQDQQTPLNLASGHGRLKIVHLLLKSGSNASSQDCHGSTPLHKAAQSGRLDIVRLLLDSGADVNSRNIKHMTPLDVARDHERPNVERLLVKWREGMDPQDRANLLMTLMDTSPQDSFPDVEPPSVRHGEDTYIPDGGTLLHTASAEGNLKIVRSLLDSGADVNDRDAFHWTALLAASVGGNFKVVRLLV